MGSYSELMNWAEAKGIIVGGIDLQPVPGRGIGFITTRDIKLDEILLEVPFKRVHTRFDVSKEIKRHFSQLPTQCQFALEVERNIRNRKKQKWCFLDQFPKELKTNSVLLWPEELDTRLPTEAESSIGVLRGHFDLDWKAVSKVMQVNGIAIEKEDFKRAWVIIETRGIDDLTGRTKDLPERDQKAMVPLAEFFNHSPDCCILKETEYSYQFVAARNYKIGEEVCTNYNNLDNDELMATYGFVMKDYDMESFNLAEFIIPEINKQYNDPTKVPDCDALSLPLTIRRGKQRFNKDALSALLLLSGFDSYKSSNDREKTQDASSGEFRNVVLRILVDIQVKTMTKIEEAEEKHAVYPLLKQRWVEILNLINESLEPF